MLHTKFVSDLVGTQFFGFLAHRLTCRGSETMNLHSKVNSVRLFKELQFIIYASHDILDL